MKRPTVLLTSTDLCRYILVAFIQWGQTKRKYQLVVKKLDENAAPYINSSTSASMQQQTSALWNWLLVLCVSIYIVCIFLTTAPLHSMVGIHTHIWISRVIIGVDRRLSFPTDLHLARDHYASQQETSYLEFALLILLAFIIYGFSACLIQRRGEQSNYTLAMRLIWLTAVVSGCIYIFTPVSTSDDIGSYASYGRLLIIHHTNPYFIPPSAFPQDPTYPLIYWRHVVTIYGPIWTLISAFLGWLASIGGLGYLITFRVFTFAAYLLNILLVTAILRAMNRSQRTIALGTLLYAWNPLVLLESSLGGHNDILMVTFILLGVLLSVRAEQNDIARFRYFVAPLVVFTLAALVKFSAIPIIAFFIVMLFWKTFYAKPAVPSPRPQSVLTRWRAALFTALSASFVSSIVALLFYGPFWIGHNIKDIAYSFSSQPTAHSAYDSLLLLIRVLNKIHSLPAYLLIFTGHDMWDIFIFIAVVCALAASIALLRRTPTTRTVALATLLVLGTFILLTAWFVPWYVTWLVGPAVVCLPIARDHLGRALLTFALAFSTSAFLTYYYVSLGQSVFDPTRINWFFLAGIGTFGIPLVAFLLALVSPRNVAFRQTGIYNGCKV
jgi:hypothetical protein